MSKRIGLAALLLSILSSAPVHGADPPKEPAKAAAPEKTAETVNGIARPAIGNPVSEAQFVWYLFVDAVRPAGGSLTFENWTEQCQLNPKLLGCPSASAAEGKARTPHGSALAAALRGRLGKSEATQGGIECGAMQTKPLNGYPPPTNLSSKPVFCEEVFVNADEATFIRSNGLTTLTGQQAYGAKNGGAITFPWTSIEIKADWVPTSSFANPTFQCPDPTNKLYTETINGTCYALVGMHISSKALPDWVWATFEPASSITNPNRCDPKLYNACFDPWGTTSKVPYGKGTTVPQSPQLQQLMAQAGLNKAFNNYYLTGVQTQFVNAQGQAIPLGSSFVEFNAGVNPGQASCITCHKYAYLGGTLQQPEQNFGGPPAGWPAVGYACNKNQQGNCTPVIPNSVSQDFSWILGLMPVK